MKDDNFNNIENDDPYAIREDGDTAPYSGENQPDAPSDNANAAEESKPDEPRQNDEKQAEEPADSSRNEEANSIGADIIRGHINTIILRSLYERDKYGYEIMNDIDVKSHGQYSLKQPTLYSALKRLENQGYIKAYWKTDEVTSGGRRKYFTLTESGKEITEKNLAEWEYSRTIIDSLISDRSFDFSQPAPTPVDFHILKNSVSRVPIVRSDEADRAAQTGESAVVANQQNSQQNASEQTQNNVASDTTPSTPPKPSTEQTQNNNVSEGTQTQQQSGVEQNTTQQTNRQPDPITEQLAQQQAIIAQQQQTIEAQQQALAVQQQAFEAQQIAQQQQAIEAQQQVLAVQQQALEAQQVAQQQQAIEAKQQPPEPQISPEQAAQAEARRVAHENYLRLISEPVRTPEPPRDDVVPNSENVNTERLIYNNRPETERDYKNLIDGIYRKAVSNGSVQTYTRPAPRSPEQQARVRLVDRGRADGVAVAASSTHDVETYATKTTYNKGATLLKCSSIVLAICAIEFIFCFIFLGQLNTSWIYPTVILLLGLIQFIVFGAMLLRGYGKNCVIPTTNGYISSALIITFIAILIISAVSFLLNVNPNSASDIMKMIVIPSITALNITVFAVSFKLFIK